MNIELTGITKSFNGQQLFSIPGLLLDAGDVIHLAGENGSGKTTLMKLIAALDKPSGGKVIINQCSRRPAFWKPRTDQIIYLHQTPFLFTGSVIGNLRYGLDIRYRDSRVIQQKVEAALSAAQLEPMAEQEARTLSGGEKQRLALARAAILEPRWLLMDEPTANMDDNSIRVVTDMVAGLIRQKCGIMISSHQKNHLTGLCHRRFQLKAGRLLEVLDSAECPKYAS